MPKIRPTAERAAARPSWGAFALMAGALLAVGALALSWFGNGAGDTVVASSGPAETIEADRPPSGDAEVVTAPPRTTDLVEHPPTPAHAPLPPVGPTEQVIDDPVLGLQSPPPPLPPPGFVAPEMPHLEPLPQDVFVERRAAGIDLLDDSIERLTTERAELERSGDSEGARLAQVRIARMTALRARRVEELEQARRGELTPEAVEHSHEAE